MSNRARIIIVNYVSNNVHRIDLEDQSVANNAKLRNKTWTCTRTLQQTWANNIEKPFRIHQSHGARLPRACTCNEDIT